MFTLMGSGRSYDILDLLESIAEVEGQAEAYIGQWCWATDLEMMMVHPTHARWLETQGWLEPLVDRSAPLRLTERARALIGRSES